MPEGCLPVHPPPLLLSLPESIQATLGLHSWRLLSTAEPETSAPRQRREESWREAQLPPKALWDPVPFQLAKSSIPACDVRLVCSFQGQEARKELAGDPRLGVLRQVNPGGPPTPLS